MRKRRVTVNDTSGGLRPTSCTRKAIRHLGVCWIDRHIALSQAIAHQLEREYLIDNRMARHL
jgi:hypothetical protein